jgi:hypothetical protein
MYQLTDSSSILRLEDNALIPADETNSDYTIYLQWVEEGNEPKPNPGVRPYTWEQAIERRDKELAASDWTMIPGCTVDQHAWAVYRQVLRDIPQTFADCDPIGIIWPEKPSTAGPNTKPKEEAPEPVETPANVVAEHEAEAVTVEEVAPPSALEPVDVVTTSEDTETLAVEETVPAVDVSAPTSEKEVSATIDITETK